MQVNYMENKKTTSKDTMKSLPKEERPYEKLLGYGAGSLSDAELLAILIRSGTPKISALELARNLLDTPQNPGLDGLFHTTIQEFKSFEGIGEVKAIQLVALTELCRRMARGQAKKLLSFNDPDTVADYFMEECRHYETEHVMLLLLDSKNHLLGTETLSRGTVDTAVVTPREIFVTALRYRAVGIILLHNHPSGDPEPSEMDVILTKRVQESGRMLGIALLDHIIIGDHDAVSFYRDGYIRHDDDDALEVEELPVLLDSADRTIRENT